MPRPETQYARCGDFSIAYQVLGDGPVDLLYSQGWLSNVEYAWESPDYARFLSRLGRFARLISFDKRGTGLSDREVGFPTLDERAEDILSVLDAVGTKRVALMGVSEGGNLAAMFTATFPERVSSLTLCGSSARSRWAPDYPWGATQMQIDQFLDDMRRNWGKPFDLESAAPSVANDAVARDWFSAYLRFSAGPTSAERITRLNYDLDIRDILPSIQVPTLILHREGDKWRHVEEAHYLAAHIPNATLKVLRGSDHIPWYGDQDDLIGAIEEFVTGTRSAASTDRSLLTLLMTDIAESTQKLAAMGDQRWRSVLEQLDASVRGRVAALGGQMIKHTGDGHLLAFTGPTRAIECARSIGRDAATLGLALRTGIHTGECERRGDDLSGMAVHLAARIMAEAEPGAVLTSGTVKDLVVGSGFAFAQRGERELKGIPGRWPLFAVSD
jgi:pimeloyl-ACP methyl ester carboxylesterase